MEFFRIANNITKHGLWYNQKGNFTGLVHKELSFCKSNELQMPFDSELIGFLSATRSIGELLNWFSIDEIIRLQSFGYFIYVYESYEYKFYEKFQHFVICQNSSKIIANINLF